MQASSRIAHLTTVHPRYDVRIFHKECTSLAARGYEAHLIVADGEGAETLNGVVIHDVGVVAGRLRRMLLQPLRAWRTARRLRALLYHIHDPELLLAGLLLSWGGARVVYDSHEDVPRAVLSKDWIHPWVRHPVAAAFEWFENSVVRRLSAVVAATPHIARRFARINPESIAVNNYPLQSEIGEAVRARGDARALCYIGGIGRIRGVVEMVRALEHVDAKLILAGPFEGAATEQEVRALPGWAKVDYRGVVSRAEVRAIMAESRAGLLFFHPEPNHVDAQPNKMFEYMSAGLPVLASDFALWRSILDEARAGLCADPFDPQAIARVIGSVLDDPSTARAMGERGREAVLNRYQWAFEEPKLADLYFRLIP
jgi:glycosyltransferase involved in cell wall biosynthesis